MRPLVFYVSTIKSYHHPVNPCFETYYFIIPTFVRIFAT